ncbi:MAG: hypothetical protein KDK44_04350 [Chlamydiia bacterium]|nr:hypothetical protein [Chlamydiia bacterium]
MKNLLSFDIPWKNLLLKPFFLIPLICAAFLPTLYCLSTYFKKADRIEELEVEYNALIPKIGKVLTNKNNEHTFKKLYANVDHFYCEKHLEALKFLKPQINQLKFLSNYGSFAKCSSLKNQLQKLSGSGNALLLSQTQKHIAHLIQETEEKLMHPIEIDRDDLLKLLAYIEGCPLKSNQAPVGRPNLLLTRFSLSKRVGTLGAEAFFVDFDLVKREPAIQKEGR